MLGIVFDSLQAFWPGLQVLLGDLEPVRSAATEVLSLRCHRGTELSAAAGGVNGVPVPGLREL